MCNLDPRFALTVEESDVGLRVGVQGAEAVMVKQEDGGVDRGAWKEWTRKPRGRPPFGIG